MLPRNFSRAFLILVSQPAQSMCTHISTIWKTQEQDIYNQKKYFFFEKKNDIVYNQGTPALNIYIYANSNADLVCCHHWAVSTTSVYDASNCN